MESSSWEVDGCCELGGRRSFHGSQGRLSEEQVLDDDGISSE
jgi:hypothetical protein